MALSFIAGCEATSAQPDAVASAQTAPATQPVKRECIRVAKAADLQLLLFTSRDPAHHFPVSLVKIYNSADEDVIVAYEPGSVVIHCGSYQQPGPPVTFVRRREILGPHEPLEIAIPPGGWSLINAAGERELMVPTDLPPGAYDLWASFRVEGDREIQSRHETFERQ
jgi:hypothetical protein